MYLRSFVFFVLLSIRVNIMFVVIIKLLCIDTSNVKCSRQDKEVIGHSQPPSKPTFYRVGV